MNAWLWLLAIIAFGILEAFTMTLVSVWFVVGSIGGMIAAILGANTLIQTLVFAIVSAAFLMFTRPFVKKVFKVEKTKTNADRLIGDIAVVTEDIDNFKNTGQAKIYGQIWTARAENDDTTFNKGDRVLVKSISGVKLIVSQIDK